MLRYEVHITDKRTKLAKILTDMCQIGHAVNILLSQDQKNLNKLTFGARSRSCFTKLRHELCRRGLTVIKTW